MGKLPAAQQRKLRTVMNSGAQSLPREMPARTRVALLDSSLMKYEDPLRGVPLNPFLTAGHSRRSHAHIVRASNGYERDMFRGGGKVVDRDAQKFALQQTLAGLPAALGHTESTRAVRPMLPEGLKKQS